MLMSLGHIGLNVKEIDRSTQFYKNVLGYQVIGESHENGNHFAFLGQDNQVKLTLWQQTTSEFNKQLAGLHHLAFQVDSIERVQEAQKRLKDLGVKFIYDEIVPHRAGAQSGGIFFEDPDGIRLEIYTGTGAEKYVAPSDGPSCGFF
jgi:lactoylglutathione lyase